MMRRRAPSAGRSATRPSARCAMGTGWSAGAAPPPATRPTPPPPRPVSGFRPDELDLRDGRVVGPEGSSVPLAEAFQRLGTSVIEEYVEFFPEGGSPENLRRLYAGQVSMQGGAAGKKMMYAFGAELV